MTKATINSSPPAEAVEKRRIGSPVDPSHEESVANRFPIPVTLARSTTDPHTCLWSNQPSSPCRLRRLIARGPRSACLE